MDGGDLNLLIVELVLAVIEPHHLLACRLVNHAWNSIATKLLDMYGWKTHLQLNKCTDVLEIDHMAENGFNNIAMLGISYEFDPKYLYLGETMQAAFQIAELPVRPPLTSIQCSSGWNRIDPAFLKLIKLNATTLRRLYFVVAMQKSSERLIENLDFELPALKSIDVTDPRDSFFEQIEFECEHPSLILAHILAAPNLERLHFSTDKLEVKHTINAIHEATPLKLRSLVELSMSTGMDDLECIEDIHTDIEFTCLRTLKISSWSKHWFFLVPNFVRTHCPMLDTLELSVKHKFPYMKDELQQITHLKFEDYFQKLLRWNSRPGNPFPDRKCDAWDARGELTNINSCMKTMACFPNLISINLQFEFFLALTKLFANLGGSFGLDEERNIPTVFCTTWPKLRRLHLTLLRVEMRNLEQAVLDNIGLLINHMYPNLENIFLTLGAPANSLTSTEWMNAGLKHALALIFGLRVLKSAEITTHYISWDFPQMRQGTSTTTSRLQTHNMGLKSITIRMPTKRSQGDYYAPYSRSSPDLKLCIPELLELIPETPNLLLRIDARLALSDHGKSFDELAKELQSSYSQHPRVVLL